MTTLVRIAVAALVAFILSSCNFDINLGDFTTGKKGNGKVVKEIRDITEDFTEVSVSEGLMVYLVQADEFKIDVEADENVIDLIATDIKNGKLRIHAKENIGQATKNIYVSLPEITVLQGSSGAHLEVKNVIKGDKLEVDGSSGALLEMELVTNSLEMDASSGANLTISGEANRAQVHASSGGNINATKLNAKICDAEASSGGNLKIEVSDALTTNASSGGSIGYSGNPKLEEKKSVSGSVHQF